MSRNLLHLSKLEPFKQWLNDKGVHHRPGRGDWQVLQVCKNGKNWHCVYKRAHMPEHYTIDLNIENLVLKFLQDAKKNALNIYQGTEHE